MSTAIIRTSAYYDFGDLHLKNQTANRTLTHLNNSANSLASVIGQSSMPSLAAQFTSSNNINNNNSNSNSNNHNSNSLSNNNNNITNTNHNNLLNNNSSYAQQQQQQQQQQSTCGTTSPNNNQNPQQMHSTMLQQRINAAAAAMVAQQHQKMMLHNALTRAVSHPANGSSNVVTLMNTLIENLGHRKLERTQSEPLPQVNTSRYKTELCRPFEEAGECKYGEKCQFAHGMHELRNLQRHPKYKTELCRTFHSVGFCPYGPRCHFVHNAEEARNHNRAVHAAYVRAAAAAGQPMPLSPPMSMSTGSDRASPTGSLSLSPTNSLASFFPDQTSPTNSYISPPPQPPPSHQAFAFPQSHSPPASPISQHISPVSTPPPASASAAASGEEARLPIFNQLSSTMDAFKHLAM